MKQPLVCLASIVLGLLLSGNSYSQQDKVKYVPEIKYPLFKEVDKRGDSLKAMRDSVTASIRERQKKTRELKDSTKTELRFDISGIEKPASFDEFKSIFHFPPTPQDASSTCWAFSGTSFIESEIFRLNGRKIKLSEMYTVYFEYIEKVRRFVRERGESAVGPGSEVIEVPRIMKLYGAVPRELFTGLPSEYPHFVHNDLDGEIYKYVSYIKDHNFWDEEAVISSVRVILDKYIGKPPEVFEFEGRQYSPKKFAAEIIGINLDDYVVAMSTLKVPFYVQGLFDVDDNWSRDSSYYNLPLKEWYRIIKDAVLKGYSVAVGGGTSEPGYYGMENVGLIPDFDIPQNYINQDSREYRIFREITGDDHGLHLVGYLRKGNRDWFLVKDSGSGSRKGQLKGYFFFRDDYIRMKMLTFMVHKDLMKDLTKEGRTGQFDSTRVESKKI